MENSFSEGSVPVPLYDIFFLYDSLPTELLARIIFIYNTCYTRYGSNSTAEYGYDLVLGPVV
jgi:hypothetical protein